jgi:RiboL-PSP-HEPN
MSKSKLSFESSIQEAELILGFYDRLNLENSKSKELEVLKRAGLIIALTAWETYVEDRVSESVQDLLLGVSNSTVGEFMNSKLSEELKRFHTPNSDKTQKIFYDYLRIDVHKNWSWNNFDLLKVKKKLDELVVKRGEAAHRARDNISCQKPDLIKIEDLRKSISFLRNLVEANEKCFQIKLNII